MERSSFMVSLHMILQENLIYNYKNYKINLAEHAPVEKYNTEETAQCNELAKRM